MTDTSFHVLLNDLQFDDGPRIIESAAFTVESGETLGIMGPSGSGKTTLLRVIGGLEDRLKGLIRIEGTGKIGMLFQDYDCFPWMSVWENVRFASRGTKADKARQLELLTRFGLLKWKDAWPWQLSGGMRKRLGLARCILADPDLLLLDEPFGSLDYGTKLEVSNVLVKYLKENNKKAILVSHSVDDLMMLADRALISRKTPLNLEFKCGRSTFRSSKDEVLTRLQDEQFRHELISLTMV
jgi:ABC-type nitrate/sulfonate/bicarbonate transport system ATPase subunit